MLAFLLPVKIVSQLSRDNYLLPTKFVTTILWQLSSACKNCVTIKLWQLSSANKLCHNYPVTIITNVSPEHFSPSRVELNVITCCHRIESTKVSSAHHCIINITTTWWHHLLCYLSALEDRRCAVLAKLNIIVCHVQNKVLHHTLCLTKKKVKKNLCLKWLFLVFRCAASIS